MSNVIVMVRIEDIEITDELNERLVMAVKGVITSLLGDVHGWDGVVEAAVGEALSVPELLQQIEDNEED